MGISYNADFMNDLENKEESMSIGMKSKLRALLKGDDAGFMMTESLGSMLFYLIMLGVISALLYAVFSSSKLSVAQQSVTSMAMQVQGLYSGSSTYSGLDNALALKSGVVPKKLLKGNSINTPWGGLITLAPGTDTGTFTINLEGIKEDDCTKLATYQLDMWVGVAVNGTELNKDTGVAGAASSCSGSSNTIMYTVR